MTPEELRAAFIKSRGLNLTTGPIVPNPVQTVPIIPTEPVIPGGPPTDPTAPPFRMPPPEATDKWRSGVVDDVSSGVIPNPSAVAAQPKPPAFPTATAPAVPYSRPVVEAGPAGLSLASNPITAGTGWEGSVGQQAAADPKVTEAFGKGQKFSEMVSGLEEIAKGIKNKSSESAAAAAATINPSTLQPNQPSSLSHESMNQMMTARRNRGLTLTGR